MQCIVGILGLLIDEFEMEELYDLQPYFGCYCQEMVTSYTMPSWLFSFVCWQGMSEQ